MCYVFHPCFWWEYIIIIKLIVYRSKTCVEMEDIDDEALFERSKRVGGIGGCKYANAAIYDVGCITTFTSTI